MGRADCSVGLAFVLGDLFFEDADHAGELPGVFLTGGGQRLMGLQNMPCPLFHRRGMARLIGLQLGADLIGTSAPRGDGRLPRVLRQDELVTLLDDPPAAIADDDPDVRIRDDAVLELLYGSGLRIGELCALGPADLDLDRARAVVWGKGGKQRAVPLSAPAVTALRAWIGGPRRAAVAGAADTDALFVNRRGHRLTPRDARRILDRRAVAPTHPHALRHRFAQNQLDSNDAATVAAWMGISVETLLKVYAQRSEEELAYKRFGDAEVPAELFSRL